MAGLLGPEDHPVMAGLLGPEDHLVMAGLLGPEDHPVMAGLLATISSLAIRRLGLSPISLRPHLRRSPRECLVLV